ncbi:ATP-binding protein [Pendulispora rubella]|uniref:histidine kinase n=1 Tax=Pendulispora rubella TaxID=2741070 RepID=A0ABZ2L4R4_9BACT
MTVRASGPKLELDDGVPRSLLSFDDGRATFLTNGAGFGHVVQFYDEDEFLNDTMIQFLGGGLSEGDSLIVVAVPRHRDAFQRSLSARGFDVKNLCDSGQMTLLDAHEVLSQFMVGSTLDRARFEKMATRLLETTLTERKGAKLRIFGEMVDLLCQAGNPDAAVRLEELWNDLAGVYSFSLLCGYSMSSFQKVADARAFENVCSRHSHVFPTEGYSGLDGAEARLREIGTLQQRARALESEIERRKELEKRLREALEREVSQSRMKDEFLATVSHELRTPLNAILGWASMLRVDPSLDMDKALETIERNARSQGRLIEDVLDMSRIITGKLKIERHPIDLANVIRSALEVVAPTAQAKDVRVEARIAVDPCPFYGDADRLQQIFWNLLSNALKFTPKGGRIEVRLEQVGPSFEVQVIDSGRGIAPEFLPHIFERFRQADTSTTRAERGLGLGLAIVRYLVELHGGTIRAHSEGEGTGTRFVLNLPVPAVRDAGATASVAAFDGVPPRSTPAGAGTKKVLEGLRVVACEDDQDARDLLFHVLNAAGAMVRVAGSAREALEHVQEFRPDVVVSDIGLPEVDGYAFMRQLRAMPDAKGGRTPAIALTAYARGQDARKAFFAGYQLHLAKPVEPGELVVMVANLAGRLTDS